MRSATTPWLLLACLAATGCSAAPDADAPAAAGQGDPDAGPCVSYYADSDEIAGRGRLVQLDFSLRYAATRSARTGGGDTSMVLDAQSQLEGKGSQLACAWDTPYGGVRYELVRNDGEARPLPGTHSGTAMLKGARVTQANGATMREEVDMGGTLETLRLVEVGPWEGAGSRTCVALWFDAPLRGQSVMRVSAPGLQREEPMDPSGLVLDGYSALSPKTYNSGDHRFVDQAFSICSGEQAQATGSHEPPAGLTISDDGQVWQRSGPWTQHASLPLEQRTVDFTLRVVPPALALD